MKPLFLTLLICTGCIAAFSQRYYQRYVDDTCKSGDTTFIWHEYAKAVYIGATPILYADYKVYQIDTIVHKKQKQQEDDIWKFAPFMLPVMNRP